MPKESRLGRAALIVYTTGRLW